MNITFRKDEFLEKLYPCMGSVSSKNTINSIEGVLVEAKKETNMIKLTTYDMKKGVVAYMQAERVLEEGSYIINAQRLQQIVKLMPEEIVNLTVDEKFCAVISSGKSNFSLFALRGADFPNIPELSGEAGFTIESYQLKKMIGKVIHSVAEQDTRIMLCGAYFNINGEEMEVVSCDSYTLSRCTAKCDIKDLRKGGETKFSFIVPGHALNELMKIISDKGGVISIYLTRKHAIFNFADMVFFTRLIDEDYIDYLRIMPKEQTIFVKISRESLAQALERANLIAEEKSQGNARSYVKLTIEDGALLLTSKSISGEVYDEVPAETSGGTLKIAFNCRYLINSIRASEGEEIMLAFKGATQSMTVTPVEKKDDEDFFYMVLPVRMIEQ